MGLLRILGLERRDVSIPVTGPAVDSFQLLQLFGHGGVPSLTSPEAALKALSVAERCVALVSRSLAAAPCPIYRRLDDGGRQEATGHPLWRLLNVAADDGVSAFRFREAIVRDCAVSGNGYAEPIRDGRGALMALRFLPWRTVAIERLTSGRVRYRVTSPDGRGRVLLPEEILHIRYASRDGVVGLSPLQWAGGAVELAVSQALLAQEQTDRGLVPDVIFQSKDAAFGTGDQASAAFGRLKAQLRDALWNMAHARQPRPLLLEAGYEAKPLSPGNREAQFLEARVAGLEAVATAFGVPLSVVGLGRNASYGSLSEESRALVAHFLRPWAAQIESEMRTQLLSQEAQRSYEIAHDLSDLLRGSPLEQLQTYETGIRAGIYSPNEVRGWEQLNRREGGDAFVVAPPGAASQEASP